ncbi:nucleotide pyrophosphohydrolase [Polynucleobacter asymbioticus]|jgi:NTP pyrophosphatase (non-canonical NTP hydrolase)|uniref:Nucleotide pyrophosphohydrolase n=1 Tax=Polynucleobacter asymbioticus TaxID=576611 RepID=A0AAC9NHZ9_9BURK|nr:nucleotide pyrophosphohydrolase [Polynucleobacter asymbioticus]APB97894.1 nucleotide pyrophosphohydrolase [Polynucleobacter asymbioticus]APC00179.1 nucleotide pyrophosphohydrolase [Polynucleobacter asymbioticus]
MSDIADLTKKLIAFRDVRDWKQFHNPKDLAVALSIESGELLEAFLWKSPEEASQDKVKEELADVFAYAFLLANECGLDVAEIVAEKIEANNLKYPVNKAKGSAKKYNEI